MSSGGIFKIITNTGDQQDKYLTSNEFLKKRIQQFMLDKGADLNTAASDTYENIDKSFLPTINFIEKTHTTFIHSAFKPYVSVGFEYVKTRQQSPKLGNRIIFTLPQVANFVNDLVLRVKLTGLRAIDSRDRVRYVSMLGHRLLKNIKFEVAGNLIDEYTPDDVNMHYEFEVPEDKKIGWMRNMGQEVPHLGYVTSDPSFNMEREYRLIGDGNQTLKQSHDEVELFIPILFWFKDIQNALPNMIIPHGQTNVIIELATASEIVGFANYSGTNSSYTSPTVDFCELYSNHIYMMLEVQQLFMKKFSFSLIRVHRHHKQTLYNDSPEGVRLHNLKWPVETLYFGFRPQSNLSLSQYWNKHCTLLSKEMKVPVVAKNSATTISSAVSGATITGGVGVITMTEAALSAADDAYVSYNLVITGGTGYNSLDITKNRYIIADYNGSVKTATLETAWTGATPDATTTVEVYIEVVAINVVSYYQETPVVDSISLECFGITLFQDTKESFYNQYLPYRFGAITPRDRGLYLMNFNLYPSTNNQPSGHLNLSRARELYLKFTSTQISQSNPVDLIVVAKAINFLLVKDGGVILKYAT